MNDFERAFTLMDAIDEGTAERLEPTPYGPVLVHDRLRKVHDLNFLRAEAPGAASAAELAAEAERVQGAAGVPHRRVNLRDAERARQLEPAFVALGWQPERFVLMTLRREPEDDTGAVVRELGADELRPLWEEAIRAQPHGKDEDLVRQIVEHRQLVAAAIATRFFAVEAGGRLVAHAELYSADGVGQVENVLTLPEFRNRGFARALVLHAVGESRRRRNDLTFLVADADDWPQQLYKKLGFETIGRYGRFLKTP